MNRLKFSLAFFVFLFSLGVYVLTLNPSISAADSNEMVTTAIVLGIPHQPSYPIQTLSGHLFSKIPFGPLPWRVNLMSAVFQALTVTLIYLVILKLFSLARTAGPAASHPQVDPPYIALAGPRLPSPGGEATGGQAAARHPHPTSSVANDFPDGDGSCRSAAPRVSHTANKPGAPAWGAPPRVTLRLTNPYTLYPYYLLAASSAFFLAFSLVFWQYGTRAEVFPLNNFWGALLTLIAVLWWERVRGYESYDSMVRNYLGDPTSQRSFGSAQDKEMPLRGRTSPEFSSPPRRTLQRYSAWVKHLPEEALKRWGAWQPPGERPVKPRGFSLRLLYLFTFVSGWAFTHHQTVVLLAPAFLFVFLKWGAQFWFKKEVMAKLLLCFLLGVLPYFFLIPMARANPPVKWGKPETLKGVFKALTRSDYGTFSPYAQHPSQIEGQPQKETPVTQQLFYLKSLNRDFTFLGIILAILGAFYLSRHQRKIFLFLFLGFFFAGPLFLGFANYTLDSGFHQAVAKRFQILPNLFFTLFLSFGLFFLWEKFRSLELDFGEKKNFLAAVLIMAGLSSLFFYPLGRNFPNADNRDNFLTFSYARDSLAPTPKNALILISGDITTFAFEYWRTVVEPADDRIVFSPGLLYLDWYVERLKKNHPEVIIPPAKAGRIQASTTEVIEANWERLRAEGRPVYISPELSRYDPEVGEKYVLWPKHLLFLVKQKGEDLRLEPYRTENEALWQSHDLELLEKTRKNNPLLEYAMVPEYARHHFNLGAVFESVHLYDDALREYERALKIHPGFPDPYKNLGRVYGFKLKNKDYQKAFDNFNMFLVTALPSQQADVEAVKGAMGELQEEIIREATKGAKLKEATESGEVATPSTSFDSVQDKSSRQAE